MLAVTRFLRHFLRPAPGRVEVSETVYRRGTEPVPATVIRPAGTRGRRLPGWVVLHGLTWTGREHPALLNFCEAVAATGRVVLIPDIPEWRALQVAPSVAIPTIQAAVRALHDRPDVEPDHTGLLGFSFGGTQALIAAADPPVAALLRGVVCWGGYESLRQSFRYGFTGHHELDGTRYFLPPDPYGAWVMGGNYLTAVPGHEENGAIARALHTLASDAGARRAYAWDPLYDETKLRLRAELAPHQRATFDLLAPLTTEPPAITDAHFALADAVADAAARVDPLLVPTPYLPEITVPTVLAHGRDDRLVPFTESVRLARKMAPGVLRRATVTALFAHSGGTVSGLGRAGAAKEGVRFLAMLNGVLGLID